MILTRGVFSLPLALFALFTTTLASDPDHESVNKRSAPLDARQGRCSRPGWIPACPGFYACVPVGALCCADGINYAMPPDTCSDGAIATATIGAATTVTLAPSLTTRTVIGYTWYTTTITYYYYYYYYTVIDATSYTVTSSRFTTATTVSVSATDAAAASSLFSEFSRTLPTPAQTETITASETEGLSVEPTPTLSLSDVETVTTSEDNIGTTASFTISVSANGTITAGETFTAGTPTPASTTGLATAGAAKQGVALGMLGAVMGMAAMV